MLGRLCHATPIAPRMPVLAAVANTPVAPVAARWEALRDAARLPGHAHMRRLPAVSCATRRQRPRRRGVSGADEG